MSDKVHAVPTTQLAPSMWAQLSPNDSELDPEQSQLDSSSEDACQMKASRFSLDDSLRIRILVSMIGAAYQVARSKRLPSSAALPMIGNFLAELESYNITYRQAKRYCTRFHKLVA